MCEWQTKKMILKNDIPCVTVKGNSDVLLIQKNMPYTEQVYQDFNTFSVKKKSDVRNYNGLTLHWIADKFSSEENCKLKKNKLSFKKCQFQNEIFGYHSQMPRDINFNDSFRYNEF